MIAVIADIARHRRERGNPTTDSTYYRGLTDAKAKSFTTKDTKEHRDNKSKNFHHKGREETQR